MDIIAELLSGTFVETEEVIEIRNKKLSMIYQIYSRERFLGMKLKCFYTLYDLSIETLEKYDQQLDEMQDHLINRDKIPA